LLEDACHRAASASYINRMLTLSAAGSLNPGYIDRLRLEHLSGHATYFGKML